MDVTFLYQPGTVAARLGVRRRVLVSVLRGTLDKQLLGKTIGAATTAQAVPHRRRPGAPAHRRTAPVDHLPAGSTIEPTSTRLAGTTLLWQRRALLVRVEGDLPRAA